MTIPEQAVQAAILWAVNIHGPDDLIAAPDYLSAVRMANAFNAWWLNLKMKQPHNDAIDARMWAVPTDWEGNDARGHADELSKPHPEYQWLRDVSAAPHLAAVQVKKLELNEYEDEQGNPDRWDAEASSFGVFYSIEIYHDGFRVVFDHEAVGAIGVFDTLEAAKAAAQADYEARILSALEPSYTIETYYARQIEWSKNTFGPALRTKGIIDHIKKELKEIEAEPHDLSEWIDVVILAMDGFWRHGGTVDDLMPRLLAKQQKNLARTWPDWRTMSEDAAIEHDRTKDAAPSAGRAAVLEEAARVAEAMDGVYDSKVGSYAAAAIRALHPQADKPSDDGAQGEGWQDMAEAPRNGKHCILAVKRGAFIYAIQGAFQGGKWNTAAWDDVEPLCWKPTTHIPDRFLPTPPSSEVA